MACYLISGKTLGQIKASGASIPANSSWNSLLMSRWGLVQTLSFWILGNFGEWEEAKSSPKDRLLLLVLCSLFKLNRAQKAQHMTTLVETMVPEAEGKNWSKSGLVLLHDKSSPIGTLMSLPAIINMLFKARDALWLLGWFIWFVFVGNKLWTCNHKWF